MVDDTNQTHKFVTTEEKTTWNNKSDFSGSYDDLTNKPFIPTKTSDILNNSGFITKDVNNLTNYELKVDTGHSIAVSIDTSTYVVTIALKNSAGDTISSGTVDLPLESVVVNGRYDNVSKSLILVLDNGNEVTIPVGDLVSGLVPDTRTIAGIQLNANISKGDLQTALDFNTKQNVINTDNKLASDYVDDTNQTNKFVTSEEKTTWNNKSDFSGSYTDLTNKPDLDLKEDKANKTTTLNKRSTTEYLNQKGTYNNFSPLLQGQATGDFINLTNAYDTPPIQFELLGNATQDTTILTYKCAGTETGDYYFVYSSTNYQFTMPTVASGDILTFNTSTKKLYKGTTQITTTTASTGTLITLSNTPNPDYPQDIHVVTRR